MVSFGLDFGTTNSVLATASGASISTVALDTPSSEWAALGFDKVLPSVIAYGGPTPIFGWAAKKQTTGKLQAVKRLLASDSETVEIGGKTLPLEQAAASLFRHVKDSAMSEGLSLDRAVVTIPANSRGNARLRTKVAAGLAGIEVQALINEPTAAAMAFARTIQNDERVLVYDFGGGTLDVTVLKLVNGVFMEEASKGVGKLGGIDIDDALARLAMAKLGRPMPEAVADANGLLFDIELAKIRLSTQTTVQMSVAGDRFELTRDDLNQAAKPLIERSAEPIRTCLADLGGQVKLDHLVLVGGSSKLPAVPSFVADIVGCDPLAGVDPMTAIAEGAALASSILNEEVETYDFFVGTEHALGTIVVDPTTQQQEFSVLIPRNNMLPAEETDLYRPAMDNQPSINVQVIEGDPGLGLDHDDNVILKSWDVELAEPRPRDEAGVSITYRYDVDGILRVAVIDLKTESVLMDEELSFGAEKRDLARMKKDLDSMMGGGNGSSNGGTEPEPTSSIDAEAQALIDKVTTKILPFVDDDEQQRIQAMVTDLKITTPDLADEAKRRLGEAMREHAYLL